MRILCRLIAVMLLTAWACFAQAASISITPSSLTVAKGDTFALAINITGVSDLYGFQFNLGFNPALLSANSITEGAFLPSGGATLYFAGDSDNTAGSLSNTADALNGALSGVTGDGLLATVSFKALAAGTSSIDLLNSIFLDSSGNDITLNGSQNASVTINPSVVVTPIPAAVWLFSSAMVGLLGVARRKAY